MIKINIKRNNEFIYLPFNKKTIIILKIFLEYNIILGFSVTNNIIKIVLNLNSNNKLYNLCKPTGMRFIKVKDIIKYTNKNTGSIYIISTSKGLLSFKNAIKLNVGGILLFKIL